MSRSLGTDYLQQALHTPRVQFLAQHPYLFLVSESALLPAAASAKTIQADYEDVTELRTVGNDDPEEAPQSFLIALKRRQAGTTGPITIGRNAGNDVIIPDMSVSRVHAHIRVHEGLLELVDAGSRNGTWLGKRQLVAKAPGQQLKAGCRVRFGRMAFTVLTAAELWDQVRNVPDW